MTNTDYQRIQRLMRLANAASELEFVDVDLVSHFHYLREDLGLAKLLMLIQEYVIIRIEKTKDQPQLPPTETVQPNSDQTPV